MSEHDTPRPVLVLCECCGSEGTIYTSNGGPYETDNGECPACNGTGLELVPSDLIELEDLDRMSEKEPQISDRPQCDCGNALGHRYGCAIFKCSVCGEQSAIAPANGPAFCEKHCPDHDYRYERGEGHRCVTCNAEPPPDWFLD